MTTFLKSPIDNVLMWRRRDETCINNKSPSTITQPQGNNFINRHFRITRKRKKAGRPKKTRKKKPSSNTKSITTDKTKREKTHQSSMTNFLLTQQSDDDSVMNTNEIIPDPPVLPLIPQPTPRRKRKQVNELDDYKIVRRTNMSTYQQRLQAYQERQERDTPDVPPAQTLFPQEQSSQNSSPPDNSPENVTKQK